MSLGGYTTIAALRGEIGASMMESRIMETMLIFVNDTLVNNFEKIKKRKLFRYSLKVRTIKKQH